MSALRPLTPLEEQHAAALARWFQLHTLCHQARTARRLRQLKAELAQVDAELAELEALLRAQGGAR